MKDLKIVIDLKDVYVDYSDYSYDEPSESEDVNSALKREIQGKVLEHLIKGFSPEVVKILKDQMIQKFGDEFGEKVSQRISRAIEHGVFSDKSGTFNVHQYVQQRFEGAINNTSFTRDIDRLIKSRIEEMQKNLLERYDMAFAAGIIKNLKEGNLLKDGAEKLLLKQD